MIGSDPAASAPIASRPEHSYRERMVLLMAVFRGEAHTFKDADLPQFLKAGSWAPAGFTQSASGCFAMADSLAKGSSALGCKLMGTFCVPISCCLLTDSVQVTFLGWRPPPPFPRLCESTFLPV